jgi:hypothetical protein
MAPSGTNSHTEAQSQPLPLFRPEALAAQERIHGEVLRIRPLSAALFPWLGAAVVAVTAAYLFAGHYTEKAKVIGSFLTEPRATTAAASSASASSVQAVFLVPARWIGAVQQGTNVGVRCPGGPDPGRRITAPVVEISPSSTNPAADYTVTLALSSDIFKLLPNTNSPQSSSRLEAEIPLGRRHLVHMLMERSQQ